MFGTRVSVGRRLLLGLLPSLLAIALVAGLGYWGEHGRTAPGLVITGAGVLAVASLLLTWLNARDLTQRIGALDETVSTVRALVAPGPEAAGASDGDEFARIEVVIARLRDALATAEEARQAADRAADAQARAQAALIEATVLETMARLDEMRLPLHILLENRFGELNENQEELLVAARHAGDALDAALRRLQALAAAEQGTLPVQHERVAINDVVRGTEPQLLAIADRTGRTLEFDLEPGLGRAWADRAKLSESLVALVRIALVNASSEVVRVCTTRGRGGRAGTRMSDVVIVVSPFHGGPASTEVATSADGTAVAGSSVALALAVRVLEAQGASVSFDPDAIRVTLCDASVQGVTRAHTEQGAPAS